MKNISLIFLICYINLIFGFLKFPVGKEAIKLASISSSQTFDNSKVKVIETPFEMTYVSSLHFQHSNSPIAPRTDGGYYIAFTDKNK